MAALTAVAGPREVLGDRRYRALAGSIAVNGEVEDGESPGSLRLQHIALSVFPFPDY
jgi:hypothetical protein